MRKGSGRALLFFDSKPLPPPSLTQQLGEKVPSKPGAAAPDAHRNERALNPVKAANQAALKTQ